MPSALSVGTKQTFQAIQGFYKHLFTKEYLGNASMAAKAARKSKAKLVTGRVLSAVAMTAGAPVVLPVVIAKGIYRNTKAEQDKRTYKPDPPAPPPVVTPPTVPGTENNQPPSSLEDCARKLLLSRGISAEGAAAMAAFVYRETPEPELTEADIQVLSKVLDEDPTFNLTEFEEATA